MMFQSNTLLSCFVAFALATTTASQGGLNINVRPTASGQYDILVDGEVWFPGSAHTVALHNYPDIQVTSKTTKSAGKDSLGDHTVFSTTYASSSTKLVATASLQQTYYFLAVLSERGQ